MIGVIIGRFQVPSLTEAHLSLINHVAEKHSKILILIGVHPGNPSEKNPLDFFTRKLMIQARVPNAIILPIIDCKLDSQWSQNIDTKIVEVFGDLDKAILYGGRDSFIKSYSGKFKTVEVECTDPISGTEVRTKTAEAPLNTPDFRKGAIYATSNRYKNTYPVIDIIIVDGENVILARKSTDPIGRWRFPGGFVDPTDVSLEAAVRREAQEETGLTVEPLKYLGSSIINDWRYNDKDKIMSMLFLAIKMYGPLKAGDDVSEVKVFPVAEIDRDLFVEEHQILFEKWKLSQ